MIIATVPSGSAVGEAVVVVNVDKPGPNDAAKATTSSVTAGGDAKFSVAAPEFDPSHFEVLTGVGAVLAGKEATSYTTRNDAISSTNVGRKTPEILLGGGFILPWHKGGRWIENSYCGKSVPVVVDKQKTGQTKKVTVQAPVDTPKDVSPDCQIGGAYKNYRPYEAFVSIRFSPASDQSINGFVLGGGYRITKYLSLLAGYSVTPVQEVSRGFRIAAAKIVTDNPSLAPYNRYNPTSLLNDYPAAFDGFPLFVYNASGVTTTKLFPNDPTVSHYRSGIFFGVGFPLNLTSLFKPAKSQ